MTGFKGIFVNKTWAPLLVAFAASASDSDALSLFANSFTKRIVELNQDESDVILQYLFKLITDNHDLQVRYRWQKCVPLPFCVLELRALTFDFQFTGMMWRSGPTPRRFTT